MLLLVIVQLFAGIESGDSGLNMLASWNMIVTVAYITIGIGIINRKYWGYNWGLYSNILNALLGGYQIVKDGFWINALLIPIELFIVALLLANRKTFMELKERGR